MITEGRLMTPIPYFRARAAQALKLLLLGLLATAVGGAAQAVEAKRKVIIDDDGFSLMQMMLLEADDVDVLGITSVSGDLWVNRVTASALRGLEILGRTDVPVAPGATYPLLNSEAQTARWESLYGKLTWKGAWMKQWVEPTAQSTPPYHGPNDPVDLAWGNPTTKPKDEIAANFLIRMVHKYPGQVSIIEGGPMTNLALGQRLDPAGCWDAASLWPQRVIVMTLERVGSGAGPDLATMSELHRLAPGTTLVGAGGARRSEDLERAHAAGAGAWLVASALHDLQLPRQAR